MTDREPPIIFLSMQTITQQFQDQVEAYLQASSMDPTTFGRSAMNDPRFVFDLRNGRSASSKTMDRVIEWITANPPDSQDEPEPGEAAA